MCGATAASVLSLQSGRAATKRDPDLRGRPRRAGQNSSNGTRSNLNAPSAATLITSRSASPKAPVRAAPYIQQEGDFEPVAPELTEELQARAEGGARRGADGHVLREHRGAELRGAGGRLPGASASPPAAPVAAAPASSWGGGALEGRLARSRALRGAAEGARRAAGDDLGRDHGNKARL